MPKRQSLEDQFATFARIRIEMTNIYNQISEDRVSQELARTKAFLLKSIADILSMGEYEENIQRLENTLKRVEQHPKLLQLKGTKHSG